MEHLKPSQIPHCQRLLDIFEDSLFACDFSVMGAGKTYVGAAISAVTGLPLFVLGPRNSLTTWEKVTKEVDGTIAFTSTYESLRSIKGCQPKHGYLTRYDSEDDSEVLFAPTKKFKKLVKDGVIVVCDECQKIKNNSSQTKAVRALVSEIIENGGGSRVLLLSGSPFEEDRHAINFYRLVGFIKHRFLYNITPQQEFNPLGLDELIDNLGFFNEEATKALLEEYLPFTAKNVKSFVFRSFTEIVVPFFTSAMPSPAIDFKKDVGNGYYTFPNKEDEKKYFTAIERLSKAACFAADEREVIDMGLITKCLREVEICKIPLFSQQAKKVLDSSEKNQVIIFANYRDTIDELAELLEEYEPLIYDGRVRTRQIEDKIIGLFQSGERRLIIANLRKGGVTISLHDLQGDRPRTSLISPTYSILDMHQASARTYRQGLRSDATIRVVYGRPVEGEITREGNIIRSLIRKTQNLKQILTLQAKEGVLFPGDYPDIIA